MQRFSLVFHFVSQYPSHLQRMATVLKLPPTFNEGDDHWSSYGESGEGGHTDRTKAGIIRYAKTGVASEEVTPARTIPELFQITCEKAGDKVALQVERPCPAVVKGEPIPGPLPVEQWKKWTYQEYYNEVCMMARAFIGLGLERFDAVNIFGFNAPEWVMGEVSAIVAGGIAAGIYPSDTPQQVTYKAKHSGAVIAVVESPKEAKAFLENHAELPKMKAIIIWDPEYTGGVEGEGNIKVFTWAEALKMGEQTPEEKLKERISAMSPGHACAYIYTSGTTGNPKAVMISHDNIGFCSAAVLSEVEKTGIGSSGEQERLLSYLPLSHVAGMLLDIVAPIVLSTRNPGYMTVSFARKYDLKLGSIGDRLRTIRPTLFLGVPRVWEKVAEKLKAVGAKTKGLKKVIATWAKSLGLEHQRNNQLGGSGEMPWFYGLADGIVLKKVKAAVGLDQCKFGFTGAAPITVETLEYFGQLGIQINEVYGMSECTGATTWSTDEAHVWGSCGWKLPGMEVKVMNTEGEKVKEVPRAKDLFHPTEAEQGEICFRGRHIMIGYMANPDLGAEHLAEIQKKLDESIDGEGWLHSGDKGCMDERGMIKITGRYKELIIGAGGENIAPVPIEDEIKRLVPAISNIMMVGDKRKFNVALVTLKAVGATGEFPGGDQLDGHAATVKSGVTTISAAAKDEDFIKMITDAITKTNSNGDVVPSNAARIQKFTILPRDFSVETEELTPTLKTKRAVVEQKYIATIDAMYSSKDDYVPYQGEWPTDAASVESLTPLFPTR